MKKQLLAGATIVACAAAAVPAFAATKTVGVADNVFRPDSVSVRKGDTVRFRWTGRAPHNVLKTRGPRFSNIATRTSGTVSRRMTRTGTYRLVCSIHPGMDMTLRVR